MACSVSAHEAGVRWQMPISEATVLARSAVVLPDDPAADLTALGQLAERCDRFSPWVGWQTGDTVDPWYGETADHLFLDVAGIPALFGGEEPLGRRISAYCAGLGYTVLVTIAETIGAAWALTFGHEPLTIVPTGELEAMMRPLPIASLRLPDDMLEKLAHLGVETIEQLLQLSRIGLTERFGNLLGLRLDQALGAANEIIVPHRPAPSFYAAMALDEPTDRRHVLEWLVGELITRIVEQLHVQQEGAVQLVGRFDCERGDSVRFEVGLFRPSASATHLQKLLQLQWERLTLRAAVERVELQATRTAPLEYRQEEFFPDEGRAIEHERGLLLEKLSSRLGASAVVKPERFADPLPERAVRWVPVLDPRTRTVAKKKKRRTRTIAAKSPEPQVQAAVSERPLRLLATPVRIQTVSVVPDGPPIAFHWQKERHVVNRHWGPERIETGWWRGQIFRRDYYRVETGAGYRLWLFRELRSGAWFLHGCFE